MWYPFRITSDDCFCKESIVRRGEVLLDFDILDRWDHDLSKMNLDKVGEP